MKKKCVIVGAGTYGKVYSEYLKDDYEILGFADDDPRLKDQIINGIPVWGSVKESMKLAEKEVCFFVPLGDNRIRNRILTELNGNGFETPNFIHPTANIHSSVELGTKAIYILQGTIIMPFAKINDYVMISSGTNITHHAIIRKGVFLSFGVNVGASLEIKEFSFIGVGATIMTGIKYVGKHSLIGAGAVVIRDVPDYATVVGNPAKILKINKE